ncbi:MAG: transglycosylase SLT domain-containing protein [Pseudomonadales bacterium]|nr:transglycosylase SLT domain-containing protein [Pseudomonadales bacterium]
MSKKISRWQIKRFTRSPHKLEFYVGARLFIFSSRLFTFSSRLFTTILLSVAAASVQAALLDDRSTYTQALKDLDAGNIRSFNEARRSLKHYALYPYLEYAHLTRSLTKISNQDVAQFREAWPDGPLSDRLYSKRLTHLAKTEQWQSYVENYLTETGTSTKHRCYFLRALYQTGKTEQSMSGVESLWLNARSQPKACDPLFATWIDNNLLDSHTAWKRMHLALDANNTVLARYLLRFFKGPLKRTSNTYYQVHRQPSLLSNYQRFSEDTEYVRDIISHGIVRWARSNPVAARQAWKIYTNSHNFTAFEQQSILQDIQIFMARKNILPTVETVQKSADAKHELVIEEICLAALRTKQWRQAAYWIGRLPEQVQQKTKWRYWLARSILSQDKIEQDANLFAHKHLKYLSSTRTYYGFLAAHSLGIKPSLNNQVSRIELPVEHRVGNLPGMQRAIELFATNKIVSATREWTWLTNRLSKTELAAASKIAADIGWLNQSIRTANLAELHNDLELRFPVPFRGIFTKEASAAQVPENLLYGIGRQESAFAPAVISRAGALGLMQIMPGTAAETARKAGIGAPRRAQLLKPEMNIKLGSKYLSGLLERYNGNRAFAAAAYNAGPSRADRWLRTRASDPIDIWIESIPFKETRNYVKNVLAFTYIFSQHLDQDSPFLLKGEAKGLPLYPLAQAEHLTSRDTTLLNLSP